MSGLWLEPGPHPRDRRLLDAGVALVKSAGAAAVAYDLAGTLQRLASGAVVVSVPAALVRGVFAALHAPGLELPSDDAGLPAHVAVFRPDEVEAVGGPETITERGKQFRYTLGRLWKADDPVPGIAACYYLRVHSPELQALRRSYGLSPLPGDGQNDFHVVVAVRRKGVLGRNGTAKGQGDERA
jgi:hypothetical protein